MCTNDLRRANILPQQNSPNTHRDTERQTTHSFGEPFRKSRVNLCAQPKPDLFIPSRRRRVHSLRGSSHRGEGTRGTDEVQTVSKTDQLSEHQKKKKIIITEIRYKIGFFKKHHNILIYFVGEVGM